MIPIKARAAFWAKLDLLFWVAFQHQSGLLTNLDDMPSIPFVGLFA